MAYEVTGTAAIGRLDHGALLQGQAGLLHPGLQGRRGHLVDAVILELLVQGFRHFAPGRLGGVSKVFTSFAFFMM